MMIRVLPSCSGLGTRHSFTRVVAAAAEPSSRCYPTSICHRKKQDLARFSSNATTTNTNTNELVLTNIDEETQIATITMNRPPANSLSLEMCQAISSAHQTMSDNPRIQGLILSSSLSSIFCAGLDLMELYKPDEERLPKFWTSFQQLYLDLYGSRLACIAAMGGHAPAAGCMLALSCDYRIMAAAAAAANGGSSNRKKEGGGGPTIGLNESQLGIVAPPWLAQQYIDTIGLRRAELALSLGTLYNAREAHEIGLVDEVVVAGAENDNADIMDIAREQLTNNWIRIPPEARVATKRLTRERQINELLKTRDADCDHFCSFVTQETVQQNLGNYVTRLMAKKKKQKDT